VAVEGVVALLVMKNWLPLVLGPLLAMARRPARSEVEVGIDFVLEGVAGVAHPGAGGVAALDHEFRNHAVRWCRCKAACGVWALFVLGVGPVFCPWARAMKVWRTAMGALLLVELQVMRPMEVSMTTMGPLGTMVAATLAVGASGRSAGQAWTAGRARRTMRRPGRERDESEDLSFITEFEGKSRGGGEASGGPGLDAGRFFRNLGYLLHATVHKAVAAGIFRPKASNDHCRKFAQSRAYWLHEMPPFEPVPYPQITRQTGQFWRKGGTPNEKMG